MARRSLALALVLPLFAGCLSPSFGPAPREDSQIKVDGSCVELPVPASLSLGQFGQKLEELLAAQRHASAAFYVDRFPDLALALLESLEHRGSPAQAWLRARPTQQPIYDAVESQIGRGEAQRKRGDAAGAAESWAKAVDLFTTSNPVTADPILLERLCALRPIDSKWPAEAALRLREHLVTKQALASFDVQPGEEEMFAWLAIGGWRLERGEATPALSAFKRAEATTTSPIGRGWAQLHQARAMMGLGQGPAAASLLTGLTGHTAVSVRCAAWATLGGCKLHDGHVQQAILFLRKALDDNACFPGCHGAMADLGIALLMIGRDNEGLELLHQSQKAFEQSGETERLLLALENEASFYRHQRNEVALQAALGQINRIESSAVESRRTQS
jgi:tetratricopeptide (TPR) repeat protein